jgi:hypothetical protein
MVEVLNIKFLLVAFSFTALALVIEYLQNRASQKP